MKSFVLCFLFCLSFFQAVAQVKAINPLSCFTWGPDQFLSYEDVRLKAQSDPEANYSHKATESEYQTYRSSEGAYTWIPEDERYSYINNVQVIRWNIVEGAAPATISVTNIFDEVLYSVSTKNSCGVIIFPDSIDAQGGFIFVRIRPDDLYNTGGMKRINSSYITIQPRKKEERIAILKDLQPCGNLACKVEKLKAQHATLDLLSLLELEKIKDPQNKAIDKMYWDTVSLIRFRYLYSSLR